MPRDKRPFITVHDGMPEHAKIEPLSDAAFRLLIELWCYCSRNRTDGKLTGASWGKRGTAKARKELLNAGLAERLLDGDVLMHDYLEHQRSADEIDELSAKRREAGKKGGNAKATCLANAKANANDVAKQTASKSVAETDTETDRTKLTRGGERTETSPPTSATKPPEKRSRCTRHPNGNPADEPCDGCRRDRELEDRRAQREADKAARAAEAAARECTRCDGNWITNDDGTPSRHRCDHQPLSVSGEAAS